MVEPLNSSPQPAPPTGFFGNFAVQNASPKPAENPLSSGEEGVDFARLMQIEVRQEGFSPQGIDTPKTAQKLKRGADADQLPNESGTQDDDEPKTGMASTWVAAVGGALASMTPRFVAPDPGFDLESEMERTGPHWSGIDDGTPQEEPGETKIPAGGDENLKSAEVAIRPQELTPAQESERPAAEQTSEQLPESAPPGSPIVSAIDGIDGGAQDGAGANDPQIATPPASLPPTPTITGYQSPPLLPLPVAVRATGLDTAALGTSKSQSTQPMATFRLGCDSAACSAAPEARPVGLAQPPLPAQGTRAEGSGPLPNGAAAKTSLTSMNSSGRYVFGLLLHPAKADDGGGPGGEGETSRDPGLSAPQRGETGVDGANTSPGMPIREPEPPAERFVVPRPASSMPKAESAVFMPIGLPPAELPGMANPEARSGSNGQAESVWSRLDAGRAALDSPATANPSAPLSRIEFGAPGHDRVSVQVVQGSGGTEVRVSTKDPEARQHLLGGLNELAGRMLDLSLGTMLEGGGKDLGGGRRQQQPQDREEKRQRPRRSGTGFTLPAIAGSPAQSVRT